jgi:hypothetical protein
LKRQRNNEYYDRVSLDYTQYFGLMLLDPAILKGNRRIGTRDYNKMSLPPLPPKPDPEDASSSVSSPYL